MGYPPNTKGYLLSTWDRRSEILHKYRCSLQEDIFPFHEINFKIQQNKILNISSLQETFVIYKLDLYIIYKLQGVYRFRL